MKILLFGWFNEQFSGEPIAQGFEQKGAQVIRISTEPNHPAKSGKFDLHVMDDYAKSRTKGMQTHDLLTEAYQLQFQMRRLKLQDYIDRYPDIDFVFFIQNKYSWDFEGVTKPVYYYHTTIITSNLPLHAEVIKGFFHAYIGAPEEFRDSHTYEFNHWYYKWLIPYGADPKRYFPEKSWDQRLTFCGFMGSYSQDQHTKNGVKACIYENRWKIISGLVQYIETTKKSNDWMFDGDPKKQWWSYVDIRQFGRVETYAKFLQDCKVAINIPGNFGKLNQRMFEILGSGALLLQWDFPELKELGLIDHQNCLVFTNLAGLIEQLRWIYDNPVEADQIRKNGIRYFQDHYCSWQHRAGEIYDRIMRLPTDREQETIIWVEYETKKEQDPTLKEEYPVQMYQVK